MHEILGVGTLTKNQEKVKEKMARHILCNTNGDVHLEMHTMFVV